ncbi:DIP1984 family protein [Rubrivirga sp. S365]|uniref:DIP1984 family protein n=1 Tax=Rubrivirga litoralis TaxID=3075598 RepID=A0ABU3BQI1_9BACT|nr:MULTISPECIES: DIP1984 family protein [unclassified Rubrivirga]MDT0631542.1 DIP1984 family protein [Rubrivirga sp. F394]MDT7855475.1 DIP1984 family protein [Rubrivirga sp. S365]
MKLAEALLLRSDLQKRLEQLKSRLLRNARVQQGDEPSEAPDRLIEAYEEASAELERLIRLINRTNLSVEIAPGFTLTDALARRDVLRLRADTYRELARAASVSQDRYLRSEVKFVSTVEVRAVQQRADDLSRELRELDARVQETNWQYDLME